MGTNHVHRYGRSLARVFPSAYDSADLTTTHEYGKPGYDSTGRVAGLGDSATGGLYSSDVAKQPQNAAQQPEEGQVAAKTEGTTLPTISPARSLLRVVSPCSGKPAVEGGAVETREKHAHDEEALTMPRPI